MRYIPEPLVNASLPFMAGVAALGLLVVYPVYWVTCTVLRLERKWCP